MTEMVLIKYTKMTIPVYHYDTGIELWEGIDSCFRGQQLRGKVVCKLDATDLMTDYFTAETLKKFRPVILMIAKGQVTDPTQFSNVIKEFIQMDETFANKIRDIYAGCPEDCSFGVHLIRTLASFFTNVESNYRTFFRGRPEVVICMSDGYLYYSFNDDETGPLLPDKVDCEVLSYVKNWNGEFHYYS